jgi:CHAT domain-containing protein
MDMYNLNLVSSTWEVVNRNITSSQIPSSAVVYGGLEYDIDADTMRREAAVYTETQINSTMPLEVINYASRKNTWSYLFYTREESRNIQRLFERNNIPVIAYNSSKGNKESFISLNGKKTSVIHLATHGFFIQDVEKSNEEQQRNEYENPLLRSGLILSGANNAWANRPVAGVENGIMLADEIARLNLLETNIVVLSACETALGGVNNSEGVFGLQRAFKLAGVQTLIMSLWEVSDQATSILMREFYQNWFSGMSKQEALKEAQRYLRANTRYSHPNFWAAFIMMD